MAFLKTNVDNTKPEGFTFLSAGTHLVKLTSLKHISKINKIVAEFTTPDGNSGYTEWLGMDTPGQEARTGVFIKRLGTLAGLQAPDFETPQEFERYGEALVSMDFTIRIVLVDDEYQGKVKQVLAGRFDDSLLPAAARKGAF